MRTIRHGKIARLPEAVREQVNQRLADHESGTPLLKWLNALPEVQAVLASEFRGRAVNGYNLHEWRHGGHAEWRQRQEAQAMIERLHADSSEAGLAIGSKGESVTDVLATWLAARYAVAVKKLQGQGGDPVAAWSRLRECCHDVVALRRGEYRTQRLEFERDRAAWVQGKREDGGLKMEDGAINKGRMKNEEKINAVRKKAIQASKLCRCRVGVSPSTNRPIWW